MSDFVRDPRDISMTEGILISMWLRFGFVMISHPDPLFDTLKTS